MCRLAGLREAMRLILLLVASAASGSLTLGCGDTSGSTRHSGDPPAVAGRISAEYRALTRPGPSGISVVSLKQARAVATTRTAPIWVAVAPESPQAIVPEIASAREVRHEQTTRIWIAESSRGGVCVLVFRPEAGRDPARYHSIAAACGSADELQKGAVLMEHSVHSARGWVAFGAVPSAVTRVTVWLADGHRRTGQVSNNSYSIAVPGPIERVTLGRTGVGP